MIDKITVFYVSTVWEGLSKNARIRRVFTDLSDSHQYVILLCDYFIYYDPSYINHENTKVLFPSNLVTWENHSTKFEYL